MVRVLPVTRCLTSLLLVGTALCCLTSGRANASMNTSIGQIIEVEPILAIDARMADATAHVQGANQDIPLPEDGGNLSGTTGSEDAMMNTSLDNTLVMFNQEKQVQGEALLLNAQLYARQLKQQHQDAPQVQKLLLNYFSQAGVDQDTAQSLLKEINDKKVKASPIILQVLNRLASSSNNE